MPLSAYQTRHGTIQTTNQPNYLSDVCLSVPQLLGVGQVEQENKQDENVEEDKTHTAMLLVFLDSAMNLPRAKKSLQEPSPQATLTVGQQVFESAVKQTTNEPRWEQNFKFMLQNPNYQNLEVEILTPRANPEWTKDEEDLTAEADEKTASIDSVDSPSSSTETKKEPANGAKPAAPKPEPVDERVTSTTSDKAEQEAKLQAERAAKQKAEAEREAKLKADKAAKEKAEREAKLKAERDAKEREAKLKAEKEAKEKAEKEAEKEAKRRAEEEEKAAKLRREQESEKRVEEAKQKTQAQLDKDVQMETEAKAEDATLFPSTSFNPEADCDVLAKAMSKTFGADEDAIIEVLSKRSQEQRQQIAVTYKTKNGKELHKDLTKKLKGNFETICVDMLSGPAEFDAKQLYKAMKGLGSDEQVLVEIICSRSNDQLNAIKATYKTLYGKELEAAVIDDTSGDFQRLLVGCLQARRPEGTSFDRNRARQDAQELLNAGEKNKWGTNESTFQKILLTRSYAQLRATFQEYAKLANKDIEETIKDELGSDLRDGMLTIVRVIRGKPKYFAKALYKSMKGLGTDDDTLVRIVASRCEVDMVQIKEAFKYEYGKTLGSFISDDCTGDYRKMLLALIGDTEAKR
ncbi:annexin [Elysia marginata]|uniref:Annexin n=1 Tax=Elysia marginata TaxID=1093978 RepID=A0AAV4FM89_9GAST|nr:annexin [Elysia marginata]